MKFVQMVVEVPSGIFCREYCEESGYGELCAHFEVYLNYPRCRLGFLISDKATRFGTPKPASCRDLPEA